MDIIEIRYCFKIEEHRHEIIDLRLDSQTLETVSKSHADLPAWTMIDFHQCPHCLLDAADHPNCPVAVNLVDVVERFENVVSYDKIDLEVTIADRRVSQHTTAQRGISSLLGLLFATSGCPHTSFFKPMARFHLPMATRDDTVFRAAGMYLLAQYFLKQQGQKCDFGLHGIKQIYNNLHLLNLEIIERMRSVIQKDSSVNALILLDMLTDALPSVVEDNLEKIRHLFTPYLSDYFKNIIEDIQET